MPVVLIALPTRSSSAQSRRLRMTSCGGTFTRLLSSFSNRNSYFLSVSIVNSWL